MGSQLLLAASAASLLPAPVLHHAARLSCSSRCQLRGSVTSRFLSRRRPSPCAAKLQLNTRDHRCEGEERHAVVLQEGVVMSQWGLVAAAVGSLSSPADALAASNEVMGPLASNLELGVQLLYLGALLALLGGGSFLVVRQVLMRRELENVAKELQERVRSGQATSEEYFELGAVMLRKKFYTAANKYLLQALKKWDGEESELAQVHNALGFSYYSEDQFDDAIAQYEKAVSLQPSYATAWNNLADAYERKKNYEKALRAYKEVLNYDPSNTTALERSRLVRERLERFSGIPSSSSD